MSTGFLVTIHLCDYITSMRSLALMAFLALQLSVFTCGFDIHVHAAGLDTGHIAEHIHDDGTDHEQESHDHGCHVHASHTYTMLDVAHVGVSPVSYNEQYFSLSGFNLKNLPFLIEYPPKSLHS